MNRDSSFRSDHAVRSKIFRSPSLYILLVLIIAAMSSCSAVRQFGSVMYAGNDYFRVEAFPAGDQTAVTGSTGKGIVCIFDAPLPRVWPSVKRAAEKMDKLSRKSVQGVTLTYRPVIAANDAAGAMQIGNIVDPGELGDLSGIGVNREGNSWADEFVVKADAISSTQTKLLIIRRVVESIKADQYALRFKLHDRISTGNYERWFLTQIEDDLKSGMGK